MQPFLQAGELLAEGVRETQPHMVCGHLGEASKEAAASDCHKGRPSLLDVFDSGSGYYKS